MSKIYAPRCHASLDTADTQTKSLLTSTNGLLVARWFARSGGVAFVADEELPLAHADLARAESMKIVGTEATVR